jgi:acetolactate synthase regulatory subunit
MLRKKLTYGCLSVSALLTIASCDQELPQAVGGAGGAGSPSGAVGVAGGGADAAVTAYASAARRPVAGRVAGTPAAANAKELAARSEQAMPGLALPGRSAQPDAMLIRSGSATVEVDSIAVGIARVRRLAQQTGALVANTVVQTGREERRNASLELRVPSDRFDAVVNGLEPIGKVESVNVSAEDVGEEYVDLTARIANARRLEARLIQLLASRAGRLTDVLTVERELARVREEIERYEGRLRYLQSHVSVSSLTVVVHEPPPVVASHPGQNVIGDAFVEAWRRFVMLTAAFIASLGVLIPVGAVGVAVFVLGRRYIGGRPAGSGVNV